MSRELCNYSADSRAVDFTLAQSMASLEIAQSCLVSLSTCGFSTLPRLPSRARPSDNSAAAIDRNKNHSMNRTPFPQTAASASRRQMLSRCSRDRVPDLLGPATRVENCRRKCEALRPIPIRVRAKNLAESRQTSRRTRLRDCDFLRGISR